MGRVEIVTPTVPTVGATARAGRGGKKYACPISLFFWVTPYAGKLSS